MTVSIGLLILLILSTVYGLFRGTRETRRIRARRRYPGQILSWDEPPAAGFSVEGLAYLTVLTHWLAATLLAVAAAAAIARNPQLSIDLWSAFSSFSGWVAGTVLAMSAWLTGWIWGQILPSPFGTAWAGGTNYGLSPSGILFAGHEAPWECFSGYSVDSESGWIRLWSAQSGAVTFAFQPESPQDRAVLEQALSNHLPHATAPAGWRWRAGGRMLAVMTLVSIGFTAVGLWSLDKLAWLGLAANAALLVLFMYAGGRLLMRFGYGGKMRPVEAKIEPGPP